MHNFKTLDLFQSRFPVGTRSWNRPPDSRPVLCFVCSLRQSHHTLCS